MVRKNECASLFETVINEMMQVKTNELRTKHPLLASMLDRIRQMNNNKTLIGSLVLDALEHTKDSSSTGSQSEWFAI